MFFPSPFDIGYTLFTSAPFSLLTKGFLLQLVLTDFATSEFFHQIRCTTMMGFLTRRNASLTWHRKVVYLCSRLLHIAVDVESRYLSKAEKKIIVYTRWANSQNDNFFHQKWSLIHFEWICSAFSNIKKILSMRKITWFNSQLKQTRTHVDPQNQHSKKTRA